MLDSQTFANVVSATPLVSVDIIVVRGDGEVLLGLRSNRPAQGCWFVPGGRIFKSESIHAAIIRVAENELGLGKYISNGELKPSFHGVYEHMYQDCFAGDIGISTHYVVLAFKIAVPSDLALPIAADEQHVKFRWWSCNRALKSDVVHQYTKNYFLN